MLIYNFIFSGQVKNTNKLCAYWTPLASGHLFEREEEIILASVGLAVQDCT